MLPSVGELRRKSQGLLLRKVVGPCAKGECTWYNPAPLVCCVAIAMRLLPPAISVFLWSLKETLWVCLASTTPPCVIQLPVLGCFGRNRNSQLPWRSRFRWLLPTSGCVKP